MVDRLFSLDWSFKMFNFQNMRNYAMKTKHTQRYFEYKAGKRADNGWIEVPKAHAFMDPTVNPRYNE